MVAVPRQTEKMCVVRVELVSNLVSQSVKIDPPLPRARARAHEGENDEIVNFV